MSLIDVIKRRKNIVTHQSEGINLAISLINEFKGRTFTFRGMKKKYIGLKGERLLKLIQEDLDSMLVLYHYATRAKTYIDKKGVSQAEVRLVGRASTMNRFNPLDMEISITTETP
jgi:hypothetical protein